MNPESEADALPFHGSNLGLPPHAYLIQRRLDLARKAIESGISLADAAIVSGFSDQSHMTRRFKAAFGVTPGQYQKDLKRIK